MKPKTKPKAKPKQDDEDFSEASIMAKREDIEHEDTPSLEDLGIELGSYES